MTLSLVRLLGPNFPNDLLTGDARLDTHLRALDASLAGAASVRRHTVMEARDFLLEARDHALGAGHTPESAADRAIEALGDLGAMASEQRARLASAFWRAGLATGIAYATLMLGFSLLDGRASAGVATLALVFVLQVVLFGGIMGYCAAYVFKRAEPKPADSDGPDHFRVAYTPVSTRLCWGLVIAFTLMLAVIAAGPFGRGPFAASSPWLVALLLLVDLRVVVTALRGARFHAEAKGDTVVIDGLTGRATLTRDAIMEVRRDSIPMQLLVPGFGQSWCITWRDAGGHTRRTRISISQDLVHGDRLLAWLEDAARANAPRLATAG